MEWANISPAALLQLAASQPRARPCPTGIRLDRLLRPEQRWAFRFCEDAARGCLCGRVWPNDKSGSGGKDVKVYRLFCYNPRYGCQSSPSPPLVSVQPPHAVDGDADLRAGWRLGGQTSQYVFRRAKVGERVGIGWWFGSDCCFPAYPLLFRRPERRDRERSPDIKPIASTERQ